MRSKQKKVGLNFHTQVVLMTTATLLVIGTGVILLCEWDNTMSHLNWGEKINAAFSNRHRREQPDMLLLT